MTETGSRTAAEVSDWVLCRACKRILLGRRFRRGLRVCGECGHHEMLTAPQRVEMLFDEGSVRPLEIRADSGDPLGFTDSVPYPLRRERAREATGLDDAAVCVRGRIRGRPAVAVVMDFGFLGGSLGSAVGDLVVGAARVALEERTPLLLVTASGGARMQEGALALMQMARTSRAMGELDEAGILTISLVTDPTYGGVAASFATQSDVIIAESGARLGFAGPRVIEQTIGESLPPGFQTAGFLLEKGMVDAVRDRSELKATLAGLLAAGDPAEASRRPLRADAAAGTGDGPRFLAEDPGELPEADPWDAVRLAREVGRPTFLDYTGAILEEFLELRGDRVSGDCPAVVGGLGRIGDTRLVVVGHQKGHTAAELNRRNFGMASPAGHRKAVRLFRLAAKLGLPVLTLVDTPGAFPGREAEEQGQSFAIADSIRVMAGLPVPTVSVVTGEGGSGGALALATADRVLICSNAVYSVISPEGCASILWKDAGRAPDAAAALRLDARSLLDRGVVDAVVLEPEGGAHRAPAEAAARLRESVATVLAELAEADPARIVHERRERFQRFGTQSPSTRPTR
ncbi:MULTISPECIES: carboxyltransferase subunit alpha [unclassified Nocardiopsis]|uniref:carboxyltransferase subunit alpha n=1 Tax=Nocardiopsis TaxID=2013 RepID=UPI00387AAE5F